MEGALTVPVGKMVAVPQTFYFCPSRSCLTKTPVWSNIKYKEQDVSVATEVTDARRALVSKELDLKLQN